MVGFGQSFSLNYQRSSAAILSGGMAKSALLRAVVPYLVCTTAIVIYMTYEGETRDWKWTDPQNKPFKNYEDMLKFNWGNWKDPNMWKRLGKWALPLGGAVAVHQIYTWVKERGGIQEPQEPNEPDNLESP